ncbi:hypothetical protein MPTK1_6g20380 [Marchantia polymorpha subsp. ruderalis]|nr:hypothetical protein MARPO_0045s0026 [Marchantia polymorpha]BBN15540.1 hypothetical protein Mp_6g20380 [Marchantia polymorpha subsp. ruderalis]|eukprot:PTQ39349.1 hypothetical protein MARPO_0045s0026 [Marchantia polymorpha]
MREQIEEMLVDIGKQLGLPQPKRGLLSILKKAALLLQDLKQYPPTSTMRAVEACAGALAIAPLLNHRDEHVKLLVAFCITEVMRIAAPHSPYDDGTLMSMFCLLVNVFEGVNDIASPWYPRRIRILESVAHVESCVIMLDLNCVDLLLKLFTVLFDVASDQHPPFVMESMQNIMTLLLLAAKEESAVLQNAVLSKLQDDEIVSPAAQQLAEAVVEACSNKLKFFP